MKEIPIIRSCGWRHRPRWGNRKGRAGLGGYNTCPPRSRAGAWELQSGPAPAGPGPVYMHMAASYVYTYHEPGAHDSFVLIISVESE